MTKREARRAAAIEEAKQQAEWGKSLRAALQAPPKPDEAPAGEDRWND